MALVAACTVRLRLACCEATRAATPNFRAAETLLTASILTASGATMAQAYVRDRNRLAAIGI